MTLILGATGQLGTAFRRLLPDAMTPSRAELDLADIGTIWEKVLELRPKRIINCAAYTAVDMAETNREIAMTINGFAVAEIARAAMDLGIPLATFSTDYVFDGNTENAYTERSRPNPINVYGMSKLDGEAAALAYPGSLVVRSSWFFSATHANFIATVLSRAALGEVRVVDDQWGRPTPVAALAAMTLRALDMRQSGLLHLASPPTTSWFGLAQHACQLADLDPSRIIPIPSVGMDRAARRPRRAVLATERDFAMPDWRVELPMIVAALRASNRSEGIHPALRNT